MCGVLIPLLFLVGCGGSTNVREHPTLESQLLDIDSVLIATPMVTIERINFADANERITELESEIKSSLIDLATNRLQEKGYSIVDFDMEKALEEDDKLAYAVDQAREGFKEAKKTLYGESLSEDEKRKFQVSVGSAVNIVAQKSGADAILLMHYIGSKKSGGSVAKDIAISVLLGVLTGYVPTGAGAMESSVVEVVFIDGVSGDVLWSNILGASKLDVMGADMAMREFPEDVDVAENTSQDVELQGADLQGHPQ